MIPILFESNEQNFEGVGIAMLKDCTRCEVVEERNGVYECEFDYPVNGTHYEKIRCGRIVVVRHDSSDDVQPFDIYAFSKDLDGIVTFKCQHISYRQTRIVVTADNAVSLDDAFMILKQGQPDNPFFYLTNSSIHDASISVPAFNGTPMTARQLLGGVEGSILDTFQGEYEWNKWMVILWTSRGSVKDVSIRYGVNLLSCDEEVDYSEAYTACVPYWKGQDANGNEIIVAGDLVSSGLNAYDYRESCVPLDLSDKFETQPTADELNHMALSYMSSNQVNLPNQNIDIDFITLKETGEYEQFKNLQSCDLCDSVNIKFPEYGLEGTFKIVKTVYDVLAERYTDMELGNLSVSLAQALGIK